MNKRIEELAKQSGFEEDGGHLLIHGVYVTNRLEKFAKAIVQECLDVLNPDDDLTSMREEYGRKLSMNMIKKHFGVE